MSDKKDQSSKDKKTGPFKTLVLYTDAGARPTNPGFGGWGMHGYMCVPKESKQGNGHSSHVLSESGYVPKNIAKVSDDVALQDTDVLRYYDCVGTLGAMVGNNFGELEAANQALELALVEKPDHVVIRPDSMYVVDGAKGGALRWKERNWKRPDGGEYKYAKAWERHLALQEKLQEAGTKITYSWVKGHCGEPGNELADTYATIGVLASQRNLNFTEINKSDPKGYWKYDVDRPPFLHHNKLYFVGDETGNETGIYYAGNHGKEDELMGVQSVDGEFSVIKLDRPDTLLEEIRQQAIDLANEREAETPPFYYINLAAVYNSKFHQVATKFGRNALYAPSPTHNSLRSVIPIKIEEESTEVDPKAKTAKKKKTNEPYVVVDVKPYLLSWRVIEQMELLRSLLKRYEENDPTLIRTDITEVLYEKVEVKNKTRTRLKDEFKVGFKRLEVKVGYDVGKGLNHTDIFLTAPSDIPIRNTLKKIENDNASVEVITWRESDEAFRYATVVKAKGAIGIWCGAFANLRYLFMDRLKALKEAKERIG